jgi:hypothetical protein
MKTEPLDGAGESLAIGGKRRLQEVRSADLEWPYGG